MKIGGTLYSVLHLGFDFTSFPFDLTESLPPHSPNIKELKRTELDVRLGLGALAHTRRARRHPGRQRAQPEAAQCVVPTHAGLPVLVRRWASVTPLAGLAALAPPGPSLPAGPASEATWRRPSWPGLALAAAPTSITSVPSARRDSLRTLRPR
jgi:hypothetical protein